MPLSESQAAAVAIFDTTTRDALLTDLGAADTATSGTISLATRTTNISVSGTVAFTLPNGTVAGQRKTLICTAAASTPLGTVTITTPEDTAGIVCPSAIVFSNVGQQVHLLWSGTKWRIERTVRAGVKVVTVGTTALTGHVLTHTYSLSVTGTVSSTGANALPNGTYPGDMCIVAQSTAASIPVGNINFTGVTLANVAATDLQAWGATTDTVTLTWNGAAWLVIANSGVTVA